MNEQERMQEMADALGMGVQELNNTILRKNAQNRIIFVEPNDISGHLNGVPVTPDYTDFCISFDLIVDVVSRMRANSMTIDCDPPKNDDDSNPIQAMRTYVISWSSKYDPDGTQKNDNPNQVSFMGGVRYGKRDYLTTFYTDTHYNDFKNKTIVEGLGVESVNVSFESYYAPTVKIRFIDVRGASIFGREEVLHTDEVLREDTIWGCFFTFPYPKYRLQIKGFYGQAVTYQLCCTDFRANFNSQTGNYEIDMTFLGYDFGLLADIPIQYLIAAPYCHYGNTMAHWEKERTSNEAWRMSDGRPPETFFDIKRKISAAMEKYRGNTEQSVTTEEYEVSIVDGERKAVMDKMQPLVMDLNNHYVAQKIESVNNNIKELQAKISVADSLDVVQTPQVANLNLQTQTQSFSASEAIGIKQETKEEKLNRQAKELSVLYTEYKEKWPNSNISKLKGFHFLCSEVENNICKGDNIDDIYLSSWFSTFYDSFKKDYDSLTTTKTETRTIKPSREPEKEKIQELVGFLPNIGNVFRILYCHLETFVHMIYTCADNIYSQIQSKERGYSKLGVPGIEFTDFNIDSMSNDQMDPFPAIYTYQKSNSGTNDTGQDDVDTEVQVDSWMGELPKTNRAIWEEEVLIEELFKAILHTKMETSDTPVNFNSTQFPVLPSDLNHTTIAGVGLSTAPDDLAGYLAIRAAALFGISKYTDTEAEEVGKVEAFNYFESVASKITIKNKILDRLGNGSKADALYNIIMCDGEYAYANKPLSFEKAENLITLKNTNKAKRQPFFITNSNKNLQYCYAEDDESNAFVPSRLANWGELNTDILTYHGSGNGSYYDFKTLSGPSSNVLYRIHSDKLTDLLDENDKKLYVNNEIFTVYYGGSYGDGSVIGEKVESIYNNMRDGAVSLNGYTKESDSNRFKTITNNHWKCVSTTDFQSRYYCKLQSLYAPLKEYGIDTENIGIQSDGTIKIPSMPYSLIANKNVNFSNGNFKYGDKDLTEEQCKPLIPELRLYFNNTSNTMNVFTTTAYYLQNDINTVYDGKAFPWSSKDTTREAMKALLFLMSLDYTADNVPNYLNNNNSGKIEGVPLSIILFHGALLWRKRFYNKNGFDPLLYIAADGTKIIKSIDKDEIPVVSSTNARGLIKADDNTYSYKKYSYIIGEEGLDPAIENKLIEKFIYFLNNEWKTISDNCELKKKGGELLKYADFKEYACNSNKTMTNDELKKLEKSSYVGKYFYINRFEQALGDQGLASILSEDNPALKTIKEIYLSRIIVQRTVSNFTDKNGSIAIESNTLKKYLNGFVKQIEEICGSETVNTLSKNPEIEDNEQDKDIKRLIYMYIKNMWDRWFSGNTEKMFSVKNYMANTIFIDSMYRNVYEHIHINCEILESLLDETDGKAMAFKFLSDLTTKHHCMYFAMPDYINLGDPNRDKAEEALLTLFNPMPYSKINKIQTFNRYIVMFTHKPSEVNETSNSYKYDSFDIYSHDGNKTDILPTFDKQCIKDMGMSEHDLQCTRYGYNVPAFGVQFGRQNNAIFKKINVGMQNPIQTEQAINALSLIANRGRGAGERTIFYGQDLYSVYSGYSYTATIEMMGNAQIMPLMYFQLFNVPMFRGAYMIYSVTHTMKPGDMTTTVKAMKMSKRTLPWCQEWFAHYYFDGEGNIIDKEYDDECGATGGGSSKCKSSLTSAQKLTSSEITNNHEKTLSATVGKNKYHSLTNEFREDINSHVVDVKIKLRSTKNETIEKWIVVHEAIKQEVIDIFNEIYNDTDYKFDTEQFATYGGKGEKKFDEIKGQTVIGCYQFRTTKKGAVSNHAFACAIDINPGYNPMIGCMDQYTDDDLHIRTKNHRVVKIFAKHGWGWGGSYGDFMHFSPFHGS